MCDFAQKTVQRYTLLYKETKILCFFRKKLWEIKGNSIMRG